MVVNVVNLVMVTALLHGQTTKSLRIKKLKKILTQATSEKCKL